MDVIVCGCACDSEWVCMCDSVVYTCDSVVYTCDSVWVQDRTWI